MSDRTSERPSDRPREREAERLTIDVSLLPEVVFGHRNVTWWSTVAFMFIEGTTLVLLLASYLYLRLDSAEWPPRPISNPNLLWPAVNLVLILAKCWPMRRASLSAKALDAGGVKLWGAVASVLATAILGVRWLEFHSLNVHFNENAYGTAVWGVLFGHTLLLATDVIESYAIFAVFWTGRNEPKHFLDVEDDVMYEYFLAAWWVILFVFIYLSPRWF